MRIELYLGPYDGGVATDWPIGKMAMYIMAPGGDFVVYERQHGWDRAIMVRRSKSIPDGVPIVDLNVESGSR